MVVAVAPERHSPLLRQPLVDPLEPTPGSIVAQRPRFAVASELLEPKLCLIELTVDIEGICRGEAPVEVALALRPWQAGRVLVARRDGAQNASGWWCAIDDGFGAASVRPDVGALGEPFRAVGLEEAPLSLEDEQIGQGHNRLGGC